VQSSETREHLSMKAGSLFVLFILMRFTEPGCFRLRVLGLFGKLSRGRGASAWFHGVWTRDVEVL